MECFFFYEKSHCFHKIICGSKIFFCFSDLLFHIPVNNYGHFGMLSQFKGLLPNIRMSRHAK